MISLYEHTISWIRGYLLALKNALIGAWPALAQAPVRVSAAVGSGGQEDGPTLDNPRGVRGSYP